MSKDAHECEPWMMQESAKGGKYCVACGEHEPVYRAAGQTFTRDELKVFLTKEAAELPPETWRDGVFDFEGYLIESLQTGTIEEIDL